MLCTLSLVIIRRGGLSVGVAIQSYSAKHHQTADNLADRKVFLENQYAPDAAPYDSNRLVGISNGQGHALDELLPADGVEGKDEDFEGIEKNEGRGEERLTGGKFTDNTADLIDH